jgi:hypothetical protein
VPTDPILLVFIAGALVGAAIVLLARLVPDVMFIAKHIATRKHRLPKRHIFFT